MYAIDETDFLSHHGIVGMKWGVRHGPPYPLDSKVSVKIKRKGSDSKDSRKTNAGPANLSKKSENGRGILDKWNSLDDETKRKYIKRGAIAVTAVAAVALVAGVGIYAAKTGAGQEAVDYLFGKKASDVSDLANAIPKKTRMFTPSEDVRAINDPLRHALESKRQNNCMMCTTAYDLRRRGYDVTAGNSRFGFLPEAVEEWYNGAEHTSVNLMAFDGERCAATLEKAILKQGDGARGNLAVTWLSGGGHSMAYEVMNGKVYIRDGQIGKSKTVSDLANCLDIFTTVDLYRLDRATPKLDFMLDNGIVHAKGFSSRGSTIDSSVKYLRMVNQAKKANGGVLPKTKDDIDELIRRVGPTNVAKYAEGFTTALNTGKAATVAALAGGGYAASRKRRREKNRRATG